MLKGTGLIHVGRVHAAGILPARASSAVIQAGRALERDDEVRLRRPVRLALLLHALLRPRAAGSTEIAEINMFYVER